MIVNKSDALWPLIRSRNGLHLTAYLAKGRGVDSTRSQIQKTLVTAREYLTPVLSPEEIQKYLEPIEALLTDHRFLNQMSGSVGLFRTSESFRMMNLPIQVEPTCIVATTFHVKPLLRWMQVDRDFLIIGLEEGSAHLYRGSLHNFQNIDAVIFPEALRKELLSVDDPTFSESIQTKKKIEETMDWLSDWLNETLTKSKVRLFLAGKRELVNPLYRKLKNSGIESSILSPIFSHKDVSELRYEARAVLRNETKRIISESLLEFNQAESVRLGKRNIFQIAKAAVDGKIKKLIISQDVQIFGKLLRKTGKLSLHSDDIDHEDDDVLDDIAQEVLAQGGEVVVTRQGELPGIHAALAILERKDSTEEQFVYFPNYQNGQNGTNERKAL